MATRPDLRVFALYLGTITGLSVASIAVLYALLVSGFTDFLSRFGQAPVRAARSDPGSVVLIVAGLGLPLLLVAVVVVFGATYGPDPDRRDPRERRE